MPVTASPRLGLTRWSVDADPVTREQFDADHAALDLLAAMDNQGTLAARPAAAAANRGLYYYATDNGLLYRSTGSAWSTINPTVSVPLADAAPPAIADAGAVGVSTDVAREDHTHAAHAQMPRLNADNDFTGRNRARDGYIEDMAANAAATGAVDVDLRSGTTHRLTLTGNITALTISNPPAANLVIALTLIIKQDATGSRTITWPAAVKWAGGTAPVLTTTAARSDVITLLSHDGGVTWLGFPGGLNYNY